MQKQVFYFLKDLKKNNNREWFADHKEEYDAAREEADKLFDSILKALVKHDEIDSYRMYRIYRDMRFSKDKTPYKQHFAAIYSRKQPHNRGSFYVHLEPGNCFLGGGFWNPEKEDLLRIRKAIEVEDDLVHVLNNPQFISELDGLVGSQLKRAPKGFDIDHPRIELLRYKQFLLHKNFTDEEVLDSNFNEKVKEAYLVMKPFFLYMTDVLTTDENGQSIL